MANPNIASIGRFSSQLLTYLGTQRTIKDVGGSYENTFKYSTNLTTFIESGTALLNAFGEQVPGSASPDDYNFAVSYFKSRGATNVYADTMASLSIDMAATFRISIQALLEVAERTSHFNFDPNTLRLFNELRDPSHQVGTMSTTENINSLRAREIRY